jgi:uncharacterized LabA/DUF88 family protein
MIPLTRIAVFYDGHYFQTVYNAFRKRHRRTIDIGRLHKLIVEKTQSKLLFNDAAPCEITDAHYFRGRATKEQRDNFPEYESLETLQVIDEILFQNGVVTHYFPLVEKTSEDGSSRLGEKFVDVALAISAMEVALRDEADVIALITGDADFVPLVRRVNSFRKRVILCSYEDERSESSRLLKEACATELELGQEPADRLAASERRR